MICQEQRLPSGEMGTGVIGEVWIPRGSNTVMVSKKLLTDWGDHRGRIFVYGDATGGARGSAKVMGSDWQLVKEVLKPAFERIFFRVPRENPRERARVNAVNSRLRSVEGLVRMQIDARYAPHVVRDLEGVVIVEGGSGELDKGTADLTHISDALGYYIAAEYPVKKVYMPSGRTTWK